jgi:NhaP-type Na+/H+ or K+/H+ antiporter
MGFDTGSAVILGCIACGTGAAIVIPLVYQLKIGDESRAMLFMESAFSDVLCILVTLAVIDSVMTGELHIVGIMARIVESLLFAAILGILGALAWSAIIKKVRELQDPILTTLAFLFIMFGIVETLGFSGAVASLVFGIVLGNIEYLKGTRLGKHVHMAYTPLNATEKTVFSELVYILKSFFFIYVGISIELSNIQSMYISLIFILLILASRIPIVWLSIPKSVSSHDAAIISALGSKGIAAAFLAPIPAQQGLACGNMIQSLTYSIILVSIIMCSLLIFLIDRTPAIRVYDLIFRSFGKKDQ